MVTECTGHLRGGYPVKAKRHIDLTLVRCTGCAEVLVLDNRKVGRSWKLAGTDAEIVAALRPELNGAA